MALISCTNAAFAYEGNIVVRDLNFEINGGDYLCILGENGSGKSTLIKGLLRLKNPVLGSVSRSRDLTGAIGYLPQQTAAQRDFPAGVYEVVLSGCLGGRGLHPFYTKKDKARAREAMAELGIDYLGRCCYRELSGGQQQRVLLARALCATKKLVLLDEPATGLDPIAAADLYRLISEINTKMGITVIMVSHDLCNAVKYADHILHLSNRQIFFGSKTEYVTSSVGRSFLGGELTS